MMTKKTAQLNKRTNCCQYVTSYIYQTIFNFEQKDHERAIKLLFPTNFQHYCLDQTNQLIVVNFNPNNITADLIKRVHYARLISILIKRENPKKRLITWIYKKALHDSKEFTNEKEKLDWAKAYLLSHLK